MDRSGSYQLLETVTSSGSRFTSVTIVQDTDGNRLQSLTTYSFKALAIQSGAVCDDTPLKDLTSGAAFATTSNASIPEAPTVSYVQLVESCTAAIVLQPPEDFRGATISGYRVQVSTQDGTVFRDIVLEAQVISVIVGDLAADAVYEVAACTISNLGVSAFGVPFDFYSGAPSAPSKLASIGVTNVGSSSLTLQWEAPALTGGGAIAGKFSPL